MGLRHGPYVARLAVVDGLDLERVHHQAELGHLRLGGVEHSRGQLLALPDDVLDRHRTHDGPQVAGKNAPDKLGHGILVVHKTAAGVGDRLVVVANFESNNGAHLQGYPLLGHARLRHLCFLHGQREEISLATHRRDEGTVAHDYAERGVPSPLAAGDQHCLVGRRNVPSKHNAALSMGWPRYIS